MDIDFELYKIFYHTARLQSFSDAAQALYISQSAVSQAIRNLEDKIGVPLFFRKTRNVRLTVEGNLLFKHIEQAYNFIKAGENKLYEMQNLASGEVRIGVSDTVCKYFLISHLEKYNKKYPKIKIQVINRTSPQITGMLKNGLVDFGIVTLPLNDRNLQIDKFMAVEDVFVASSRFSALAGRPVPLHSLVQYPLLMLQENSATRSNLDNYLKDKNIVFTPEIELESIDLLVEFAKIGLGIAHVLKESAAEAISRGELFEVPLDEKLPARELGIATMKDVPLARASEEFIQLLKQVQGNA